ncbi:MAG: Cof-type HAD-IIB family hydrolase [Bacillota bacterium]|nr:Cof-type HAD-IIB family hydrolase [Bacillota bacterium]
MGYKLVCIDMDGTLLDDKKEVSKENLEAVKKVTEMGVKVAVCTGRLFTSAKFYANLLGVKTPIISSNGAYIREKDKNKVIYQSNLGEENCKEILSIVTKFKINVFFNTPRGVISLKPFDKNNTYIKMNETLPEGDRIEIIEAANIEEEIKKYKDDIVKCICIEQDFEEISAAKNEISKLGKYEVVSSGRDNFEIMCKGVSKGRAAKVLADYYNIDSKDVICIGDNENDLSMIQFAGMGVVMGNGDEHVKTFANYITDTNNNSGVAKALQELIINANHSNN